jgi:imidazolonepropionase-like amidohydrolase
VFIEANDARQIRAAVDWAQGRGIEIVIVGGRESWRVTDVLEQAQVPVVFDAVYSVPERVEFPYDQQYATPGKLAARGVRLAFAVTGWRGDASSQDRNLPYDAAQAVAFGLDHDTALRALTLDAAGILGVAGEIGSIEPGKIATVIAVDGDILDIRSQVKRMWIAGQEVSLESRHTRLYERYRNRPRE